MKAHGKTAAQAEDDGSNPGPSAPAFWDNYWLQVCQYDKMINNPFLLEPAILRLDKNLATYEYKICQNVDECREVFSGLLTAYRFYNKPKGQEE